MALIIWHPNKTFFILMYLDANQNNWSWTALYMKYQMFCSVLHISPLIIWCIRNNWRNEISSYGVYLWPHKLSLIILCTRDIYPDTDHMWLHHISCRLHPVVVILDHYSSYIEVSNSNDIVFVIFIENINHIFINAFILIVFSKN